MKTCSFFFALFLSFAAFGQNSANVLTVQNDFAAFGKGDIQTIVGSTSDDVVWKHFGTPGVVPFAGTYNGHEGVARFFQIVGANSNFLLFEPQNFVENGNTVTSTVNMKSISIPTGKEYTDSVTMVFTFNAAGKITNWEAKGNAASLEMAFSK
ncbi:MAG TPA: nuclear transport factor 2 family protein [Saprospiraceae bacterium]|nr:nuclear transport factor 2 family protein [Saprospiraceae bacterium]